MVGPPSGEIQGRFFVYLRARGYRRVYCREKILLFVLPLLIIIAAVFTVFGVIQVRFEKEKLLDDLQRKARSVAKAWIWRTLCPQNDDMKGASYLVEKFEARERLQGCVIYDDSGRVLAITRRFADWKIKISRICGNNFQRRCSRFVGTV
jgi:uncharacterized membrane protein affecting hemolysin expression